LGFKKGTFDPSRLFPFANGRVWIAGVVVSERLIDLAFEIEQEADPDPSVVVGSSKPRLLGILGPGLITGASDDDPSGIATYAQAGAQFGYALTWTMLFTYPLMTAVQMVSARIGRTTGRGLAGNLRQHCSSWLLTSVVALLLIANAINIGADLGAMADASRLVLGGVQVFYVLLFAAICIGLQVFLQYARYVAVLKWLTLSLFSYVATLFMVKVPWTEVIRNLVLPSVQWERDYLTTVVAVLGTTISPYLFFWQASQEAEDVRTVPARKILKRAPDQGEGALNRIQLDTLVGMGFSNVIALAIMITAGATLHPNDVTDIRTSAQAAEALRPIAGPLAEIIFALGVIGTGLLSIPVLAGSAAYAVGEARKWPTGLARTPVEAKAFYAVICIATIVGMIMNFTSIDPIRALYWSAVINGVVAVPVMAIMMWLAASSKVMGQFAVTGWIKIIGWAATAVMAVAVLAMAATS
jgi:NRAMP (natural resistance-associated macrophage protein)-like metal ion transporter